jgi:hypothetical protein
MAVMFHIEGNLDRIRDRAPAQIFATDNTELTMLRDKYNKLLVEMQKREAIRQDLLEVQALKQAIAKMESDFAEDVRIVEAK